MTDDQFTLARSRIALHYKYEAMCKARDAYFRDLKAAGIEFNLEMSSAYHRGYFDALEKNMEEAKRG